MLVCIVYFDIIVVHSFQSKCSNTQGFIISIQSSYGFKFIHLYIHRIIYMYLVIYKYINL